MHENSSKMHIAVLTKI